MSGKQKLKRAYINVGYPRHADILSLTHRFGIQGKCASYDLILAMSEASGGIIDKDAFLYTCKLNEVQDPEAYLTYCIQKGIFKEAAGGYTNSFVEKDQESYAKVLELDKKRKGIKTESVRNPYGNDTENDRKLDIDIDNEVDLNKKNSEPINPNLITVGEFKLLKFDSITWEALQVQHQKAVLDRAIQLAESYIEKHKTKDPQRYKDLKKEAESGKAYLNSWAISQAYEQLAKEKAAKIRLDRSKEGYKKPEEAPRPQPKLVGDMPKIEPITPEQAARNKKLVEELKNKTLRRVSA